MALKSNGSVTAAPVVFGAEAHGLQAAVGYGTSMLPLIKPGTEIFLESVTPETVSFGDIVMFELFPGASVTHRVVKIIRSGENLFFRTKGDNRCRCDQTVPQEKIRGRVRQIGAKNIRSPGARALGKLIAFLSYGQAVLCTALRVPDALRPYAAGWINPVLWMAGIQGFLERVRIRDICAQLSREGLVLAKGSVSEARLMMDLWNETFPGHETSVERLERLLFKSHRFQEAQIVFAKLSGRLKAWVCFGFEPDRTGVIDVFAVPEEARRLGLDKVLMLEMMDFFRTRKTGRIVFNSHPAASGNGIWDAYFLKTACVFGFDPAQINDELSVTRENYRVPDFAAPEACVFRAYEPGDRAAVQDFLNRNARGEENAFLDLTASGPGILLAVETGRIAGLCRWIPESQIKSCEDSAWLWVVSTPARPRGYFFRLLTDEKLRGRGIGTALAAQAFRRLFDSGCEEIVLLAVRDGLGSRRRHFYERFGFAQTGSFLKLRRDEKN